MKVIFLGTPEFAIPSLEAINKEYEVVGVVTQPDKPTGRSGKLTPSPVKQKALELGLEVFQFGKIRKDGVEPLKKLNADIMVTCAYGQILSKEVLELTPNGVFNVHGSLLPKYRGASPIQWSIINGEKVTGITILKSDVGVDDGPVILQKELEIKEDETAGELFERLSYLGAECIIKALKQLEDKSIKYVAQDNEKATVCKMFKSDFGLLDFSKDAQDLVNLVRGLNPSPIAYFKLDENVYKVYKAKAFDKSYLDNFGVDYSSLKMGEIALSKAKMGLFIKCNDGYISVLEIQAPNSKRMDIKSFLNGKKLEIGKIINE